MTGRNPTNDFTIQTSPTEKKTFSLNVDPSPTEQWLRLQRDDEQTKQFAKLAFAQRPLEELYDLRKDLDPLDNIVTEAKYAVTLNRMRHRLQSELISADDLRVATSSPRWENIELQNGTKRNE